MFVGMDEDDVVSVLFVCAVSVFVVVFFGAADLYVHIAAISRWLFSYWRQLFKERFHTVHCLIFRKEVVLWRVKFPRRRRLQL